MRLIIVELERREDLGNVGGGIGNVLVKAIARAR